MRDDGLGDLTWLANQVRDLTHELEHLKPSEWAEQNRYLPSSVSTIPGYYRFDVTPYLREIVDCLDMESVVRQVAVMKGVQIGVTVGILENGLGYAIAHVKNAPCMLVTADAELAKNRMDSYITPMLQHSGLAHLVKSSDTISTRKTGKTDKRIDWEGGGFLIPMGAQNANKMRSVSMQIFYGDEVDGWPQKVGKDGDPWQLCVDRTAAYESSRKLVAVSTPLETQTSKIYDLYKQGDQRMYFVRCLACQAQQTLAWTRSNNDTGEVSGITWDLDDDGNLVPGSVRYVCKACGHEHQNHDKTKLLSPEYGAEWKPTATPTSPQNRSYHVSALYSPVGMQSWESCVKLWLEAWDVEHDRVRDIFKLQVFYNNVLGRPFEQRGERLTFQRVSTHRREYAYGTIPNKLAVDHMGSRILLLTCAVDVHKDNLAVGIFGWARGRRCALVDYFKWVGDTEQLDDPETWGKLRELVEFQNWTTDEGLIYRPAITLVDSGYRADVVYGFASEYENGVFPIKGQDVPPKSARHKEFNEFSTPMGTRAFGVTVDVYKDRWKAGLSRGWDGLGQQPVGYFNAPRDCTDAQLKELTVETKREKLHATTRQRIGWEWHRPSGAANELWDLLIYSNAALDLIAWDVCRNQFEMDYVDWTKFYDLVEQQKLFVETAA